MFESKILDTSENNQKLWRKLVEAMTIKDIYFIPEYTVLFEKTQGDIKKSFGGKAQLFFYGDNENYIIYPFFKRKIKELPFGKLISGEGDNLFDITSPYGFSGPIANIKKKEIENEIWATFLAKFHEYCFENNIVAEFTRLNPFVRNHIELAKLTRNVKEFKDRIVYVDLTADEKTIWRDLSTNNRRHITRARENKIKISFTKEKEDISAFYELYTETMKRKEARLEYFFSKDFFLNVPRLLKDNAIFAVAKYNGKTIASIILLCLSDFVHYFLGGSAVNFLKLFPNNLLFYEAILWAKQQGYKVFDLGGGYQLNDSLFRFKASFSKTTTDFHIYYRIHNDSAYQYLCEVRDRYEESRGNMALQSDYFPRYRA